MQRMRIFRKCLGCSRQGTYCYRRHTSLSGM